VPNFLKNKNVIIFIIAVIVSFSGGVMASGVATQLYLTIAAKSGDMSSDADAKEPYFIESKSSSLLGGSNAIAEIVEKVGPAVVNVDVSKTKKNFDDFFGFGLDLDPDFRHFFEEKMIPVKGAGSGFIINKKGYVLTNEHVIRKADKIKVTLRDGRSFDAKVIGSDTTLDLAIVKIEAEDLPVVKLGNSNKIRPGQWVVAIGNPYQFSNTVTLGIVSALGRNLEDIGKRDLIQTDAAINPGNSGGPLINLAGEVVGINVAIAPRAQGIGFAIPINDAKEVLNDLIKKGKVVRPWLGIYMRSVDESVANYLDLPFAEGVVITDVLPNSPASKAGLRKYDVVKKINDRKMDSSLSVQKLIKEKKPGETISLIVFRDGHNVVLTAKLGEAPK
jgi:serine protease Do